MPLLIEPVSSRLTKGAILAWLLDTEVIQKNQVGEIRLQGSRALVDVPPHLGQKLVEELDGKAIRGRGVHLWFTRDTEEDPAIEAHFEPLANWLELERKAQAEQSREWRQAAASGESSTSLQQLVIRTEDTGLGGLQLVTLGRANPMEGLPVTRFKVGVPVLLGPQDPLATDRKRGVITRLNSQEIEVAISSDFDPETEINRLRLDAAEDETAMRRARSAMEKARHAEGNRLADLRDVLVGKTAASFTRMDDAEPMTFRNLGLNPIQQEAIHHAMAADDVAIIHGPPGTGKTTTLVELICQAVERGEKVLACAPSNLGVDNLFEKLLDAGESVIRIGHPIRVSPHLRDHTLSMQVLKHRDMKLVKKLRSEANDLFRKADKHTRAGMDKRERKALREEARALLDDARSAEQQIVQDLLRETKVVCSTNTGLNVGMMGSRRFDLLVIDEACQCTEADCWIPILRADRLVLAGDHCQLPPTIVSQSAAKAGFDISLQERLVALAGDELARMLTVQYRMHEAIMAFSSLEFYDGELEAFEGVAAHRLCEISGVQTEEQTEEPLHFIDTSGALYDEEIASEGGSRFNPQEARMAAKKAMDLIALGMKPRDIAVITPYSAQVQQIREQLTQRMNIPPGEELTVEVGTVDGFQGREKEAVILSLVRSNHDKQVGFLRDTRRMNVALTRARRKLILIADSATITGLPFYERLLDHFAEHDAYHVVWEEEDA